jgi:hypothetical protein
MNVSGTAWKEAETINVENLVKAGIGTVRVKAHWERRISNTNVPQIQVAAVDSFGTGSGWYTWSNTGVVQPSPLDYFQTSNGLIDSAAIQVGASSESLASKMVTAALNLPGDPAGTTPTHGFIDQEAIWPREAILDSSIPMATSAGFLASGVVYPAFRSSATGAARFKLYVYFPTSLTGIGVNKWAIFTASGTSDVDLGSDPGSPANASPISPITGAACFGPDTLVLMDDWTGKKISELEPLDSVLGVSEAGGRVVAQPVCAVLSHPESGDVEGLDLFGVSVTPDHHVGQVAPGAPAANGPFCPAGRLGEGSPVTTLDPATRALGTRVLSGPPAPTSAPFHPWNLVTAEHNYFVSGDGGQTWLLVSNAKTLA